MTVNKPRVKLLVDALRSGEFQQGQNMLRTPDDKYCCLGVACEVARLNGIGIDWQEKNTGCDCETCQQLNWRFDGTGEALGRNVADWYGFDVNDRVSIDVKIGTGEDITMIRANDDLGWDFQKIADALEDRYLREEDRP